MKRILLAFAMTMLLASCSGGFSKGDSVVVIDHQHQDIGYCEGTVVNAHGTTVIVAVQDCKDGGLTNVSAGMSPFSKQDIYKPSKAFNILMARKAFLNSKATISTPSQFDQAIQQAEKAQMPFSVALLKLQKATSLVNAFASSKLDSLQKQQDFLHIFNNNASKIRDAIGAFFKDIHAINNDVSDSTVNTFARRANARIAQIIDIAYDLPFLPDHPNAWKKMKVSAIKIANSFHKANIDALNANGFNASKAQAEIRFTQESDLGETWFQIKPTLNEAYWLNDESKFAGTPEANVETEYKQNALLLAKNLYRKESANFSLSNTQIIADIQNAMAPFGADAAPIIKKVSDHLHKNRAAFKTNAAVLKRLLSAKKWMMHINLPFNSYEDIDFRFSTDPQKGLLVTVNDTHDPAETVIWNAHILPNGDVAILGQGTGGGTIHQNYLWKNKNFMTLDLFQQNYDDTMGNNGTYTITYVPKAGATTPPSAGGKT